MDEETNLARSGGTATGTGALMPPHVDPTQPQKLPNTSSNAIEGAMPGNRR
jgi:hypothetical protein